MIHDVPFYFSGIRKCVAAFGTVFNNITVERRNELGVVQKDFKVPIGYGSKQHWYYRIEKGVIPDSPEVQIAIVVPRIGYLMTGINFDSARSVNRLLKEKLTVVEAAGVRTRRYQRAPVPYKLDFDLSIYSKNMEDGLMIVEQIVPYFSPTVNLRILEIPEMDIWTDSQISMSGPISIVDTNEDGFTARKTITHDLSFSMTTYLYPPIETQRVIRTSIIDIDNLNPRYDLETLTVAANPGENVDRENSTVTVEIDFTS